MFIHWLIALWNKQHWNTNTTLNVSYFINRILYCIQILSMDYDIVLKRNSIYTFYIRIVKFSRRLNEQRNETEENHWMNIFPLNARHWPRRITIFKKRCYLCSVWNFHGDSSRVLKPKIFSKRNETYSHLGWCIILRLWILYRSDCDYFDLCHK